MCTPHTVCTAEEYETREPTNKLDRVCAALTQCAAGQYESQAPTVNSDRVCTDLTECVSGVEYESQEPTDKSNRVCTAYSVVCDDDQYESQERTVNSDRECTAQRQLQYRRVPGAGRTSLPTVNVRPARSVVRTVPASEPLRTAMACISRSDMHLVGSVQ